MNLNFAENFKNLRKKKNITQEKLAEVLGVSAQSVSRWEVGICYPDLELLPSIANFFGVTIDSLLSNDADSKKNDVKIFRKKMDEFCEYTEEVIDFVSEYCKKYPDQDYYAYNLMCAIQGYAVGDAEKTKKYMPVLLKNAEMLLETRYRNAVIQIMATLCDENELDKWLDMAPYMSFSRRCLLIARADAAEDWDSGDVQQGLEMLETFARQLDRRCADKMGTKKKAMYQQSVLNVIRSFGNDGEIPDGWKMFYAYKQLVLSACLFGRGEMEEGWKNFDLAIGLCKYVLSLNEEWLDIGGALFSNIRVSKDWSYAIDEKGEKHKLFGIKGLSFYDMWCIWDLLENPRWAWFNSVSKTEKYQAAVEWAKAAQEKQGTEL